MKELLAGMEKESSCGSLPVDEKQADTGKFPVDEKQVDTGNLPQIAAQLLKIREVAVHYAKKGTYCTRI